MVEMPAKILLQQQDSGADFHFKLLTLRGLPGHHNPFYGTHIPCICAYIPLLPSAEYEINCNQTFCCLPQTYFYTSSFATPLSPTEWTHKDN